MVLLHVEVTNAIVGHCVVSPDMQLVVLDIPVEHVVIGEVHVLVGVCASIVLELVNLVKMGGGGPRVVFSVIVDVPIDVLWSPLGQEGQGTTTVVSEVIVLHVEVMVVTPPSPHDVQGTTNVVKNGAVGMELDGVTGDARVLNGTTVVCDVVIVVVFMLELQL